MKIHHVMVTSHITLVPTHHPTSTPHTTRFSSTHTAHNSPNSLSLTHISHNSLIRSLLILTAKKSPTLTLFMHLKDSQTLCNRKPVGTYDVTEYLLRGALASGNVE